MRTTVRSELHTMVRTSVRTWVMPNEVRTGFLTWGVRLMVHNKVHHGAHPGTLLGDAK